jgi:hypothetical protein
MRPVVEDRLLPAGQEGVALLVGEPALQLGELGVQITAEAHRHGALRQLRFAEDVVDVDGRHVGSSRDQGGALSAP